MTVAGKINACAILIAVAAGALLAISAIIQDYAVAQTHAVEKMQHGLEVENQLPASLYYQNPRGQQASLAKLLDLSPAVQFVVLTDTEGKPRRQELKTGSPTYPPVSINSLREGIGLSDISHSKRNPGVVPTGYGGFAILGAGETLVDVTLPVFARVNPQAKGIKPEQYALSLISLEKNESRHVVGYIHAGISRSVLLSSIAPKIRNAVLFALGFVALSTLVILYMTRRITSPFATVVRMAEDIGAGRPVQPSGLESAGEFKELVALLNGIIENLKTRKTKMDVDHQLLSMKVEERTSQLSKRNQELNIAVKEVTETKDRLRQLAYLDSLTSLPNRRLFTEQLDLLLRLAKRNEEMIGLLFLDLDNFKRINDSLGHSSGDFLLREVAKRLTRCLRDSDVVGHNANPSSLTIDVSRLGGDEFTVVLNRLDKPESASIVAQRIIDSLSAPMTIEGHEIVITPSIGIAIAPTQARTVEGLLKAADTAMYHAKKTGKNNFVYYQSDMDATGVERLQLENDLRRAIERNELVLHYQPQVDTETGEVVGAEALMRWEHPEKGLIPPFKFIPLAEEMGLIGQIGEWGLREACRQMVDLQSQGLELPKVSVNVSALQFTPSFVQSVSDVLAETGLRPLRLELELTEGILMDSTDRTLNALTKLKEIGVKLSIDDFGTGYSSLSYLSKFPLDELKIDRSFIIKLDQSDNDASLVIAIIAMAKSMKLDLVAEGVETHDQYNFLNHHGAKVIQGYLFSKPVPFEDLKSTLAPRHFREQIRSITPLHLLDE